MSLFNSHPLPSRQFLHANTFTTPPKHPLSSPSVSSPTTATSTSTPSASMKSPTKRHHRTATPEQRQIRSIFNAHVYTFGIDPQADRGLLSDFFDAIQSWANTYTVHIRTLSATQLHALTTHPAISTCLGHLTTLITERDLLPAIVAAITTRFIVAYTLSEDALVNSGHPHGPMTAHLARLWHQFSPNDYEAKKAILDVQRDIHTSIKNSPDHIPWRSASAQRLAGELVSMLEGTLNPHLPPRAIQYRANVLQDPFVKGYRINFRLRMEAVWWEYGFQHAGERFCSESMVNASRGLYGDAVRTMGMVGRDEGGHGVVFAVGPVVGRREVVLKGVVHLRRR